MQGPEPVLVKRCLLPSSFLRTPTPPSIHSSFMLTQPCGGNKNLASVQTLRNLVSYTAVHDLELHMPLKSIIQRLEHSLAGSLVCSSKLGKAVCSNSMGAHSKSKCTQAPQGCLRLLHPLRRHVRSSRGSRRPHVERSQCSGSVHHLH